VDVPAHPTGRCWGAAGASGPTWSRSPAAAEHGVLLEVNAQPDRLDLDDLAVHAALGWGRRWRSRPTPTRWLSWGSCTGEWIRHAGDGQAGSEWRTPGRSTGSSGCSTGAPLAGRQLEPHLEAGHAAALRHGSSVVQLGDGPPRP
jgi:hypothetical protein